MALIFCEIFSCFSASTLNMVYIKDYIVLNMVYMGHNGNFNVLQQIYQKWVQQSWCSRFSEFNTAVAYHFCPNLPAAFTQPEALTLANLYKVTQNFDIVPYKSYGVHLSSSQLAPAAFNPSFLLSSLPTKTRTPTPPILMQISSTFFSCRSLPFGPKTD